MLLTVQGGVPKAVQMEFTMFGGDVRAGAREHRENNY